MKIYIIILLMLSNLLLAKKDFNIWSGEDYTPKLELKEKFNPKLPIWVPIAETIGANLLLSSVNKYISKYDFAQISWQSVKDNFSYGWGWDADNFFTNMWQHPFQGSIYFNTARSSGYNYWISMLMSSLGSLQWEYFMEIEHPSINDLIMTTFQGAIFGEMFYRISSLMINESSKYRILRELAITPFNPGRGFNRVINGRTFRYTNEKLYELKPYKFGILAGMNDHSKSDLYNTQKKRGFLALKYYYGNVFNQKRYKPMDMFKFDMEIQFKPEVSITQFRVYGILYGQGIKGVNYSFLWGIFQYTDYLKNDVFDIGSVSFGPGVGYLSPKFWIFNRVVLKANISVIPMGGVNSNYAKNFIPDGFEEGRDYNLAAGLSAKFNLTWLFPRGMFSVDYSFWGFATIQGARGKEKIGILEPGIAINIFKNIQLGIKLLFYHRSGSYESFDNIYLNDFESRASIGIIF